mmetsp:Transcript_32847/g.104001  ORF Transcript_32847/g.104001 Transcript_32847/m.104001 type:complete len:248 (-) Transcript_32847:389-1132(-)
MEDHRREAPHLVGSAVEHGQRAALRAHLVLLGLVGPHLQELAADDPRERQREYLVHLAVAERERPQLREVWLQHGNDGRHERAGHGGDGLAVAEHLRASLVYAHLLEHLAHGAGAVRLTGLDVPAGEANLAFVRRYELRALREEHAGHAAIGAEREKHRRAAPRPRALLVLAQPPRLEHLAHVRLEQRHGARAVVRHRAFQRSRQRRQQPRWKGRARRHAGKRAAFGGVRGAKPRTPTGLGPSWLGL